MALQLCTIALYFSWHSKKVLASELLVFKSWLKYTNICNIEDELYVLSCTGIFLCIKLFSAPSGKSDICGRTACLLQLLYKSEDTEAHVCTHADTPILSTGIVTYV